VLDIGGNIGAFAVWARSLWGMNLEITAYEPLAEAAAYFFRNVPGAHLSTEAVTVDPKPVLRVYPDWGMSSTHYVANGYRAGPTATIPVRGLHPSNLPAVDLLKIDAEGVEFEIIDHYPHLQTLKALVYEYHDLSLREAIRSKVITSTRLRQVAKGSAEQGVDIWIGEGR